MDYRKVVKSQNVTVGATATQSAALGSMTTKVRVLSTVAAYVSLIPGKAADNTAMILPANFPEYFTVTPGQTISVLQVSSGGTLSIAELSN